MGNVLVNIAQAARHEGLSTKRAVHEPLFAVMSKHILGSDDMLIAECSNGPSPHWLVSGPLQRSGERRLLWRLMTKFSAIFVAHTYPVRIPYTVWRVILCSLHELMDHWELEARRQVGHLHELSATHAGLCIRTRTQ